MNSEDKLWELKKLEHKRELIEMNISVLGPEKELIDEMCEINAQITKLLEDE